MRGSTSIPSRCGGFNKSHYQASRPPPAQAKTIAFPKVPGQGSQPPQRPRHDSPAPAKHGGSGPPLLAGRRSHFSIRRPDLCRHCPDRLFECERSLHPLRVEGTGTINERETPNRSAISCWDKFSSKYKRADLDQGPSH